MADRGGDLIFQDFAAGIVKLAIAGSPGASIPIKNRIADMMRHYLPEVVDVRLVALPAGGAIEGGPGSLPSSGVQRVLDQQINPAVRAHGGFIRLVEIKDDTAYVRFEGGCQGCAMADVTLRQGVEVMIKEEVGDIVAVVDVTDHASGSSPYFITKKGPT